jgi:hypothetical protein
MEDEVFVIPAEGRLIPARAGDRAVRKMSAGVHHLLFGGDSWNEHIYMHAFTVRADGIVGRTAKPRDRGKK